MTKTWIDMLLHIMIGQGMGLAIWKTDESYRDLQYIVDEFDEDVFTALKNPNWSDCKDSACDGNLVKTIFCSVLFFYRRTLSLSLSLQRWQQVFNGPMETFHMISAYDKSGNCII